MEIEALLKDIFDYDSDGPNIHHLMAVHGYSRLIAQMEKVDEHTLLSQKFQLTFMTSA